MEAKGRALRVTHNADILHRSEPRLSEASDSVAHVGDLLTFAISPASRVLALRPGPRRGLLRGTSATSWYDTGCSLEGTDPVRAIAAYERALVGCPGHADAHNNLGRLRHAAEAPAVAESHYRLAICADPNVALYWFNLGVAVEDQGRCAEGIVAYERAIELDGNAADAHFNLARLLELAARRAGDDMMLQRAVRHLLRYRNLTKRNAGAR
jgi:tetratricopeptide (TPR) repeat protein